MDLCWRRGGEEASLWVQALRYFAVREDEESRGHVTEILQYIEQKNLLPPLMVGSYFIVLKLKCLLKYLPPFWKYLIIQRYRSECFYFTSSFLSQVVKALSENAKTPISVLMNYITRHIAIEEEQTNENEVLIKKYSEEAAVSCFNCCQLFLNCCQLFLKFFKLFFNVVNRLPQFVAVWLGVKLIFPCVVHGGNNMSKIFYRNSFLIFS